MTLTLTDYIYNHLHSVHFIKCSVCGVQETEEMVDQDVAAAMFQRNGWIANHHQVQCKICKTKKHEQTTEEG